MAKNIFEKAFYTFVGLSMEQKENFEKTISEFFEKNQEAYEKGKAMAEDLKEKAKSSAEETKDQVKSSTEKIAEQFGFVPYSAFEELKSKVDNLQGVTKTVDAEDLSTDLKD